MKIKWIVTFLIPPILIGGISFLAFISSTTFNPLTMDYQKSKLIFAIIPEGWGFFTRDAREPRTLIYKKKDDELVLINDSGASPKYLFGLSRKTRRQNIELGQLVGQIPDSIWVACPSKRWKDCEPSYTHLVSDPFKHPVLEGEYIIIKQNPVPWAWSKSYNDIKMPFELSKILIDDKKDKK